jgi:hypothetical protein
LHSQSAYASVIGTMRPTFELVGPATRMTSDILRAATGSELQSRTAVILTESFLSLMQRAGIRFPRHEKDIVLGPSAPWRLRGAGHVRVHHAEL